MYYGIFKIKSLLISDIIAELKYSKEYQDKLSLLNIVRLIPLLTLFFKSYSSMIPNKKDRIFYVKNNLKIKNNLRLPTICYLYI